MIDILRLARPQIAELCRQYGIRKLDVFGSAVSGAFDPATSDLDFVVDLGDDNRGNNWRYFDFADALESLLGRSVDLISERVVRNPYLRAEINETKQSIYPETAHTATSFPIRPRHQSTQDLSMKRRTAQHLWTAQQSARSIKSFVQSRTLDDYLTDGMLRAAVERELQRLGAALGRAQGTDETVAARVPTTPTWVALQERIDLTYENINAKRMWSIISRHLDSVVEDLEAVMRDAPPIDEVVPNMEGTNE